MAYKPPKQVIVDNDTQNTVSSDRIFDSLKEKLNEPSVSGTTGQLLQLDGYLSGEPVVSWVNPPVSGANTTLSNLTSPTAVNQILYATTDPVGTSPIAPRYSFTNALDTVGLYSQSSLGPNETFVGLYHSYAQQSISISRGGVGIATPYGFQLLGTNATANFTLQKSFLSFGETIGNIKFNSSSAFTVAQIASVNQSVSQSNYSNTAGNLLFQTKDIGDTVLFERMIITPNGDVGIGTSTPAEKLEVAGNAKINGNVVIAGEAVGLQVEHSSNATVGKTPPFLTGNPNTTLVTTTAVKSYSKIFLTTQTNPGGHNPAVFVDGIISGNSFLIKAFDNNFDGEVAWFLVNPPAFETESTTFFTAASISDENEQLAIDVLVKKLKRDGIWEKMTAIYPLVGSSSTAHSYNLKNPAQFQLLYAAPGATHNSLGYTLNTTAEYADTQIGPSNLSLNSMHMSAYLKTDIVSQNIMGSAETAPSPFAFNIINARSGTNQVSGRINGPSGPGGINASTPGFYCVSRVASTATFMHKNGVAVGITSTVASSRIPNLTVFLGAVNRTPTPFLGPTGQTYAFFSIGTGLSEPEMVNFNDAVQHFQYMLNRA